MDKEIVRRAYAAIGFRGDGVLPELDASVWADTSAGYLRAYERITGLTLGPTATPTSASVRDALHAYDRRA